MISFNLIVMIVCWALICFSILMLDRNNQVYKFRMNLINEYSRKEKAEIKSWYNSSIIPIEVKLGKKDFDRYGNWFNSLPSYNEMAIKFWIPLEKFIEKNPMPKEIDWNKIL